MGQDSVSLFCSNMEEEEIMESGVCALSLCGRWAPHCGQQPLLPLLQLSEPAQRPVRSAQLFPPSCFFFFFSKINFFFVNEIFFSWFQFVNVLMNGLPWNWGWVWIRIKQWNYTSLVKMYIIMSYLLLFVLSFAKAGKWSAQSKCVQIIDFFLFVLVSTTER